MSGETKKEEEEENAATDRLLDLDWKLKPAVCGDSMKVVNEPMARMEPCLSKKTVPVDLRGMVASGPVGELPRTIVVQYTKPELANLISDLEDLVQALEGTKTSMAASHPH